MKNLLFLAIITPLFIYGMAAPLSELDAARQKYNDVISTLESSNQPVTTLSLEQQGQLLEDCYTLGNAMTTRQWRDSDERKVYRVLCRQLAINSTLLHTYEFWAYRRHPLLRIDSSNSLGNHVERAQKKDPNHCVQERIRHDAYLLFHAIQKSITRLGEYKDRFTPNSPEYQSMRRQILLMAQRFDRDTKEHDPAFEPLLYDVIFNQLENYQLIRENERILADTEQNLRTSLTLTLKGLKEELVKITAQLYGESFWLSRTPSLFEHYMQYDLVNSALAAFGHPTFPDDPLDQPSVTVTMDEFCSLKNDPVDGQRLLDALNSDSDEDEDIKIP